MKDVAQVSVDNDCKIDRNIDEVIGITKHRKPQEHPYDEFDHSIIRPNTYCMIRLPSKTLRFGRLIPDQSINLGKFGSFQVDDILGHPFGYTYEIIDQTNKLRIVNELAYQEHETFSTINRDIYFEQSDELTGANDKGCYDSNQSQTMTMEQIETLKKMPNTDSGRDIIDSMIKGHVNFKNKTLYSQEKYLERKQMKFLRQFTPLPVTTSDLIEYYAQDKVDSRKKLMDISVETLGLLLSLGDIKPGGKYLVVDDMGGLIVGSLMERMAGEGTIVVLHENEQANLDILKYLNFSEGLVDRMVKTVPYYAFLHPEEQETIVDIPRDELLKWKSGKRGQYYRKRTHFLTFQYARKLSENQEFDALIIASSLYIPSLVDHLIISINSSRPITVYSNNLEYLTETSQFLQKNSSTLAPTISEIRCRPYQSIPGRIHPLMSMRDGGGFLLTAFKVNPC
ncbi:Gcd10p-domain-containing protein [Nadsonia fulvescens var. elongata DSM 6958]|uniref:tRNA (adenine(58)-N(1))-methyltransferase non-catalytic subunit TRM6 n=1 Tax=Nadsonia fulvescens var. elongata DSM 6958 TaxID=857566 RepID=A0A1E3PTR6_9ASCO|nr:Gcd10p-domain-containing protein [Nadsonia fulvescens var. elongata DSM 6958]